MGAFTDGFKAAFLGGFGIDYYAKKSSETLDEIRDGRGVGLRPSADLAYKPSGDEIELANYFGFLGTVAKPVERAVMTELPKAIASNSLTSWATWATPIIDQAAASVRATPSPDIHADPIRDLYLRALESYLNAARWWSTGERENGDEWARQAVAAWEDAIDTGQAEFGPEPRRLGVVAPESNRGASSDFQRRISAAQDLIDRADRF